MIDSIQDRSEGKNAKFGNFGDFGDFLVTLMLGYFVNAFSLEVEIWRISYR